MGWTSFEGSPGNGATSSVWKSYTSIFGTTTVPSDLPTTGIYRFNMRGELMTGGYSGYVTDGLEDMLVSVDWASGAITGTLTLEPEQGAPAGTQALVMNFNGTVNTGSSRVSGNVTGPFSGTFSGALFGPRGRELGFPMSLSNGSGGKMQFIAGSWRFVPS